MENQEKINELSQDYLSRLSLPTEKPAAPFIIAIIGLTGSGRTIVARIIAEKITGAVALQANSARFLLKEAGLSWGENVREILKNAAGKLLSGGYGIVFDGGAADKEDRENISEIAKNSGAKIFYIRIKINPETAKRREQIKYDDRDWTSSFDDFRVNTTEEILANIDNRAELHQKLKSEEIPNLIGEIDNNGPLENLYRQLDDLIEKIRQAL